MFAAVSGLKLADADSHTIHYGHVVNDGEKIDEVLVSVFRGPRSYTAEDVIEINSHGGIVMTNAILKLLLEKGARMAEPGEFTKRAFLNGRIDLAQAEAVIDVIKSKTDKGAHVAVEQLDGVFSRRIGEIKKRLLTVLAHVESFVDFPEEDIEFFDDDVWRGEFDAVKETLSGMLLSCRNGEYLREGVHTVLVGKPNVGKSSILNTLLHRDRAIVSSYPGTTRDALEELIEIDGVLFRLVDTAGIMLSPEHELDYLSIEQTKEHVQKGDLLLFVLDGSKELEQDDIDIFERVKDKDYFIVLNKNDLPQKLDVNVLYEKGANKESFVSISVLQKDGIQALEKFLSEFVWQGKYESKGACIMRVRHRNAIEKALSCINKAYVMFCEKHDLELIACEIHDAVDVMKEIIGEVYSEDVLDLIFSEFCIGK